MPPLASATYSFTFPLDWGGGGGRQKKKRKKGRAALKDVAKPQEPQEPGKTKNNSRVRHVPFFGRVMGEARLSLLLHINVLHSTISQADVEFGRLDIQELTHSLLFDVKMD